MTTHSRRGFLGLGAAAAAGVPALVRAAGPASPEKRPALAARPIHTSLKIEMVDIKGSLGDKFKAAKEAGFDGIEVSLPGLSVTEILQASKDSGLPVDGSVDSTHWKITHSSPNAATREHALKDLLQGLRDTHAIGGNSILLVPGVGDDGSPKEVWERSFENINKAVPLAAELGVMIAIENVWNKFLYLHDGPADQTAKHFCDYIDAFRSPWVGMHFDIGNHQKYGKPAAWIRELGKRTVKLDIKDWGVANGWAEIGEGDIDWKDVRAALTEVGFSGWVAAEVGGGDLGRLKTINQQVRKVLDL